MRKFSPWIVAEISGQPLDQPWRERRERQGISNLWRTESKKARWLSSSVQDLVFFEISLQLEPRPIVQNPE